MTEQQLEAMLMRRGYIPHIGMTAMQRGHWHINAPALCIVQDGQEVIVAALDEVLYADTATVAMLLDRRLGAGMHHVQCAQCRHTLLQSVGGTGKGAGSTHWYVYRDAVAGPQSAEIIFCPHCGAALSEGNIREVEDEESGSTKVP